MKQNITFVKENGRHGIRYDSVFVSTCSFVNKLVEPIFFLSLGKSVTTYGAPRLTRSLSHGTVTGKKKREHTILESAYVMVRLVIREK